MASILDRVMGRITFSYTDQDCRPGNDRLEERRKGLYWVAKPKARPKKKPRRKRRGDGIVQAQDLSGSERFGDVLYGMAGQVLVEFSDENVR